MERPQHAFPLAPLPPRALTHAYLRKQTLIALPPDFSGRRVALFLAYITTAGAPPPPHSTSSGEWSLHGGAGYPKDDCSNSSCIIDLHCFSAWGGCNCVSGTCDTFPDIKGGYILSPNTTSLESGFDASFDVFISENAGDEGWGCSSSTQRTTKPPLRAERLLRARQHLGTEQTRRQMASVVAKARLETATARLAEADVCHLPR